MNCWNNTLALTSTSLKNKEIDENTGNRIHPSYIYQVSVLKFSEDELGEPESENKNK